MKLFDLLNEVKIDNNGGIGEVPDNRNVDYLGLRVLMKPSVFLSLASTLYREQASSVDYLKSQLAQGQGIASPWLVITVPQEWDDNDFSQPAKVAGHEGRNRMYAVLETEGDVPVETHLFFGGGLRSRHIKPEWIEALNKSLVPQRRASPVPGPFFEMDKKLDERKGAPGTLKAKITRLYGGDVTCSKTQKLKTRRGATNLDKRQANWFQNKHCGGATRVDEIISGGSIPGDWKKYGSGDAEMFETEFDFQKHKITISVSRDWAQSGAYVLMKKNIEPKADLIGREIIFRVDGETDPTGLLGTGAAGVMSTVVGKIVGLLHSITWDYLVFAGAGDSRQRLYTKILHRLAPGLDAESIQFGDWFLLVKNHLLWTSSQELDKLDESPQPVTAKWQQDNVGSVSRYITSFEYDDHLVEQRLTQDKNQKDLQDALAASDLRPSPQAKGYVWLWTVDGEIEQTGTMGLKAIPLWKELVRRLFGWLGSHEWDYLTFIGGRGSRNKLYSALGQMLAQRAGGKVYFDFDTSDFVVYKPSAIVQPKLQEAFDYQLPRDKWKIKTEGDSYIDFLFEIDGNEYELRMSRLHEPQKRGIYEVEFRHTEYGMDISGTGSAFKVFSAVFQLLKYAIDHQKTLPVNGLWFQAWAPSRKKLYKSMAPKLARHLGWTWVTNQESFPYSLSPGTDGYLILKPSLGETAGVGKIVKGVNTTTDVGPDAVQKQARKFLNKVSRKGVPPQIQSNGKFVAPK